MRMGNMGYIQFNVVSDKGAQRGREGPPAHLKIHMLPILMKFRPYVLDNK